MLPNVLFELSMFGPTDDADRGRRDLCWLLETLSQRNETYLADHPETPLLYHSGVKYAVPAQMNGECEETRVLRSALGRAAKQPNVSRVLKQVQSVFGGERFRDIGRIIENGSGDCDNLACWRVAELRRAGIAAKPHIIWRKRPDGGTTYHVIVWWPDGTDEDPSLILGMGGKDREADRAEEIRKNAERREIAEAAIKYAGKVHPSVVGDIVRRYRQHVPIEVTE